MPWNFASARAIASRLDAELPADRAAASALSTLCRPGRLSVTARRGRRAAHREARAAAVVAHVLGAHVGARGEAVGQHAPRAAPRRARATSGRRCTAPPARRTAGGAGTRRTLPARARSRRRSAEVIGVDVGDDRDHGLQVQERGVALVGLGHEVVAAAEPRVARRRSCSRPPMTNVGSSPPSASTLATQARRRGLAVRAGDRDAVAEAHQLGEHLGARHHRDALRARRSTSGLSALTALETTTTSAPATFAAAWPR